MAATDSTKVPGGWLGLWLGFLVTAALVGALVVAWPDDEERTLAVAELTPTTRYGAGFPIPEVPALPGIPSQPTGPAAQLFLTGIPEAVAAVLAAAGDPSELHEIAVYPEYLFVTFRDGDDLARGQWRNGSVTTDAPGAGILDLADLFPLGETDLARLPALIADAPSHYDEPTVVSHVLIDRFLPFDERVLVRVYAVPTEGSPASGGGYVSYTADGTLVNVCC